MRTRGYDAGSAFDAEMERLRLVTVEEGTAVARVGLASVEGRRLAGVVIRTYSGTFPRRPMRTVRIMSTMLRGRRYRIL